MMQTRSARSRRRPPSRLASGCSRSEAPGEAAAGAVGHRGRAVHPAGLVVDLQGGGHGLERAADGHAHVHEGRRLQERRRPLIRRRERDDPLRPRPELRRGGVRRPDHARGLPSLRSFDFPFYVGKEWRSVFTFQDNQKGLSWTPVEVFWRVRSTTRSACRPASSVPSCSKRAQHELGIKKEQVWYAPQASSSSGDCASGQRPITRGRARTPGSSCSTR